MRCEEVLPLLSERARGELERGLAAPVEAHLASCRACAEEEALLSGLIGLLEQNPPEAPMGLAFQMMSDRVWAELAAQRRRRRLFFGLVGLVGAAAAVALALLWPSPPPAPIPAPVVAELDEVEERDDPFGAELLEAEELEELDEATAERLDRRLFAPAPEEAEALFGEDPVSYQDELDTLSPAELERLDALLAEKKG